MSCSSEVTGEEPSWLCLCATAGISRDAFPMKLLDRSAVVCGSVL
jgi:hypothetical protein